MGRDIVGLDAIFGESATDEWQACADAIFPCVIEYFPSGQNKVRVYMRWMDNAAQVGFCKVDLSANKAVYHKLSFDAPGYAGEGNFSKIILSFYQWYLDHGVEYLEAHITNPQAWAAFGKVGFQEEGNWRFFRHRVRSDSRLGEYIVWKQGGRKPIWREDNK